MRPSLTRHLARPRARACGRRLALIAAVSSCGLLVLPAAAPAVTVGIAEQRPQFFTSPLFQRTLITHARILVAWDALHSGWQRADLDAWFTAARAARVTPLVTFGKSRSRPGDLPTPERYAAAVRAFRKRYPWVREFSTWNEANACGERTCRRAKLVAAYYRVLRTACPDCTLLAADLVDQPNVGGWASEFRSYAGSEPARWGLHDYLDANRFSTRFTQEVLAATRGQLWLTETGGIVDRNNGSPIPIPQGLRHAAQATGYVLHTIRRISGRIQRIYLYNWMGEPPPYTWDSGLLDRHGRPRRAYGVLRDWLSRLSRAGILTGRRRH